MAVYYRPMKVIANPQEDFGDQGWVAHPVKFDYMGTSELAEKVAERDGHSQGQLEGLFQDYFNCIYEHVLAGQSVQMWPMGTIIPTLRGSGSDTEDEYSTSLISKVNLIFRAGTDTKRRIQPTTSNGEAELKKWGDNWTGTEE